MMRIATRLAQEVEHLFPYRTAAAGPDLHPSTKRAKHTFQFKDRKESTARLSPESIETTGNEPLQTPYVATHEGRGHVLLKAAEARPVCVSART
jgi:hypothetical protein